MSKQFVSREAVFRYLEQNGYLMDKERVRRYEELDDVFYAIFKREGRPSIGFPFTLDKVLRVHFDRIVKMVEQHGS